ncbi:unnamed protein product [Acanthoscelides obtectus]|uniref:SCAN domain-containing protein 3 n=1 Tax=Acanthoscelides obtectus TaxID=200917 RepID=A0A9P0LD17_ACAOB|nr:unnamed protein product [Acanthoscelides obtectus]CAK1620762.1 SCAN domain-containing protein 3 [Acanthoscelides obtectus]
MKRKTDIAYLTNLFTKFNMVNLQLQGDSLNLIKTKSILSAFFARVKLMKQNIGRGEFSQFPNLSQTSCQEDDVSTYVQYLNALYSDFESSLKTYISNSDSKTTYPLLWNIARKFLISFPSSYLVEKGFSTVTNLLTKKRNRLGIISRGGLRLTLTKLTPNVDNLLLKHQVHPSH